MPWPRANSPEKTGRGRKVTGLAGWVESSRPNFQGCLWILTRKRSRKDFPSPGGASVNSQGTKPWNGKAPEGLFRAPQGDRHHLGWLTSVAPSGLGKFLATTAFQGFAPAIHSPLRGSGSRHPGSPIKPPRQPVEDPFPTCHAPRPGHDHGQGRPFLKAPASPGSCRGPSHAESQEQESHEAEPDGGQPEPPGKHRPRPGGRSPPQADGEKAERQLRRSTPRHRTMRCAAAGSPKKLALIPRKVNAPDPM